MDKTQKKATRRSIQGLSGALRLAIWRKAQAVWRKRKVDPIKELRKIRREWK